MTSLTQYTQVALNDNRLISILFDNEFLNQVISLTFFTWIKGGRVVAGFACCWFEVKLRTALSMDLLSQDTGSASSLESSLVGRLTNRFGDTKNLVFFSLCDGEPAKVDERFHLDFRIKVVVSSAF